MTAAAQPDSIAMSRAYWIHKVEAFPSPVAQFRMAQLVDLDDRLYENARIVYRFLVGWYHDGHGDALLSMRHVSKVMRARAPDGVAILSHSVVQRAVIALMETGWVVRTYKGRGKGRGASRFVPVMNVLELASQGRLPQLSHSGGTVQLSHSGGTVVSHPNGTVNAELSHANGPKTLLRDPPTGGATERDIEPAPPTAPLSTGLSAVDAGDAGGGFEELWRAYGHRQKKADAKAAYTKAAPGADLHARMVEAAKAWFMAWAAQGNAEAPRFTLAKWIEREEFECDPPTAFKPKERKAKQKPEPANDNGADESWEAGPMICDVGPFAPFGTFHATITGSTVEHVDEETEKVVIDLSWGNPAHGPDAQHTFYYKHPEQKVQMRGRIFLSRLAQILGTEVANTEQLHGLRVTCKINDRLAISYSEAA